MSVPDDTATEMLWALIERHGNETALSTEDCRRTGCCWDGCEVDYCEGCGHVGGEPCADRLAAEAALSALATPAPFPRGNGGLWAAMSDALTAHQRRTDANDCICGWARLGFSFPQHQADAVLAALASPAPAATATREQP